MNLFINSKLQSIPDNIDTVGKLLDFLNIKRGGTGVGLNNKIVIANNWDTTFLKENDKLLIISAAYGG